MSDQTPDQTPDEMPELTGAPALKALSPMRHECHACGHCCHGHRVRLEDAAEIALVESQAAALGVANPVEEGALRVENGGCVFLDPDQLCKIHKAFGLTQKPRVCQQYPLRVSITESGWRVGIDPGCTNNWRSWRSGAVVPIAPLLRPHDNRRPPDNAEAQLLYFAAQRGMTIAAMIAQIAEVGGVTSTSDGSDDDLPAGFAGRLVARLKAMNIARFLAAVAVGDGIRNCLAHLPAAIAALDPEAPPPWQGLAADSDAFALEVLKRHLFLRVGDEPLPDFGQAIVLLSGAVACAWADPRPEVFGPALSSWAKAMRHRAFWASLIPRPETLAWLVTGRRQPAAVGPG